MLRGAVVSEIVTPSEAAEIERLAQAKIAFDAEMARVQQLAFDKLPIRVRAAIKQMPGRPPDCVKLAFGLEERMFTEQDVLDQIAMRVRPL